METGRRGEAESFARILSGLSRSVSPDAIVRAIVEELGTATGADHVIVARRRPDALVLEATLTSTRPGVPDSTTILPIGDLMDPVDPDAGPETERIPVAVPVADASALELATVGAVRPGSPWASRRSPARRRTGRPASPRPAGSRPPRRAGSTTCANGATASGRS